MQLELVLSSEAGAVEDIIGYERDSEESSVRHHLVERAGATQPRHLAVRQRNVEIRELDEIAL